MLITAAVFLAAINLRPALSSVSAELQDIRDDLGLSGLAAGALTTLPVICMGAFAPLAIVLARRFGLERTMAAAVGLIGLATAARLAGVEVAALFAATLAVGIGIAVAQALVPAVIKAYFGHAPGAPTGLFTVGVNAGALAGAALTLPLAGLAGGGWEVGLAVWGLLGLPAVAVWAWLGRRPGVLGEPAPAPQTRARLNHVLVVRITAVLATLSLTFYIPLAWLASAFEDAGLGESSAVALLAVFIAIQMPTGLIVPSLARTPRARSRTLAAMLLVTAAGLTGAALAPLAAPVLWALLLGMGVGSTFPLGLTQPVDNSTSAEEAGRLTGVVFTGGYLIAALGPAVAGGLRDLSGDLALPLVLLAGLCLLVAPVAWQLGGQAAALR